MRTVKATEQEQFQRVDCFKGDTSSSTNKRQSLHRVTQSDKTISKETSKRIETGTKAPPLRKVHGSLTNSHGREIHGRMSFTKCWVDSWKPSKEKMNEERMKFERTLEDKIIDEAIELEMNKEFLAQISKKKWPHFVEDIQGRRRKWQDLGFDLKDCPLLLGRATRKSLV